MGKPAVHTVPHGERWANRREGSSRVAKTYDTKADAQADGRKMAMRDKTEHLIHNQDGQIHERNSYGHDPFPPRG